jgi:hypothetical protein
MEDHRRHEEEPLPPFRLTGREEIERSPFDQKKQQRLEDRHSTTIEGGVAFREGRPSTTAMGSVASEETPLLMSSPVCNLKNIRPEILLESGRC